MLVDLLLILGTAAVIKWIVSGDGEDVEEHSYDRTVKLTHHPNGRVEREEW